MQTGIGRLGQLFAYQHYGVEPDIMTLAKGLGGGVPLGALLARAACCVFEPGEQGGTFNGNPLTTAVGLAVLESVLAPGFLTHVRDAGHHLTRRLQAMVDEHGLVQVRGIGLLQALELNRPIASAVVAHARDHLALARRDRPTGLLLNAPRPSTLRFMPALTVSIDEIDLMIEGLRASLSAVARMPG